MFCVRSGELHSTRIPREHWQHRLRMAKAVGLNTVSTYVFWSQHEPEPGKFDWTGQNDVADFCVPAAEVRDGFAGCFCAGSGRMAGASGLRGGPRC
jgi:beta-galactosidase GanA